MVPERLGNLDLLACDVGELPVLHVFDDLEHEFHLLVGKDEAFLRQVGHLLLCPWAHVAVHPTNPWVGGVNRLAACNGSNGLSDLADAEDPLRNAPERLLLGERVDLRLRPRDVKVREDQDVVQGMAVGAVSGMENDPQELCVRGDLAANRGLHSLNARKAVGNGTNTADPRGNLRDLVHRLTYGELLNTSYRGDREPVSSLDDTLIIHLQGELGVAFMSRGWRDLYNFRQRLSPRFRFGSSAVYRKLCKFELALYLFSSSQKNRMHSNV